MESNKKYDEEAYKLFAKLQSESNNDRYNKMDLVWEENSSGAKIYVGGVLASKDKEFLIHSGIKRIVNTQGSQTSNPFENDKDENGNPVFLYHRISVVQTPSLINHEAVWNFFVNFFKWMDEGIKNGDSILIHCLAGAHRAPTTAASYLLYHTRLPKQDVVNHLKLCRPIVDLSFSVSNVLGVIEQIL